MSLSTLPAARYTEFAPAPSVAADPLPAEPDERVTSADALDNWLSSIARAGSLRHEYYTALLAADAAARRLHVAQIAGEPNARAVAELDRDDRAGAVFKIKQEAADDFMFGLRCALEVHPVALGAQLERAIEELPGVRELREDIAALAEAVVTLQSHRRARVA